MSSPPVEDATARRRRMPLWAKGCIGCAVLMCGGFGWFVWEFKRQFFPSFGPITAPQVPVLYSNDVGIVLIRPEGLPVIYGYAGLPADRKRGPILDASGDASGLSLLICVPDLSNKEFTITRLTPGNLDHQVVRLPGSLRAWEIRRVLPSAARDEVLVVLLSTNSHYRYGFFNVSRKQWRFFPTDTEVAWVSGRSAYAKEMNSYWWIGERRSPGSASRVDYSPKRDAWAYIYGRVHLWNGRHPETVIDQYPFFPVAVSYSSGGDFVLVDTHHPKIGGAELRAYALDGAFLGTWAREPSRNYATFDIIAAPPTPAQLALLERAVKLGVVTKREAPWED